jgi:hypothetical protein
VRELSAVLVLEIGMNEVKYAFSWSILQMLFDCFICVDWLTFPPESYGNNRKHNDDIEVDSGILVCRSLF